MVWFVWSDFIPRFCGSLALFVIVIAKPPASQGGGDKARDRNITNVHNDEKVLHLHYSGNMAGRFALLFNANSPMNYTSINIWVRIN